MPPRTTVAGPLRLEAKEGIVVFSRTARAASALAAALSLLGVPSLAFASWSPPVARSDVLLGYGALYGGCTHRGVDLRADAGERVASPVDGTVTFAGSVPADGGGTCNAVTIETADGLRVSIMPIAAADVAEGCAVRAGAPIGSVAAEGDSSSPTAHVHVSLRRGDTYLDPSGMLPVCAPTAPEPAPQPSATVGEPQAAPPAPTGAITAAAPAVAAMPVPAPAAPVEAVSLFEVQSQHAVRMPRDAQEVLPPMLHSAPAATMRGLRLPSGIVASPGVFVALVLSALLAVVAAFLAPRHALDRL